MLNPSITILHSLTHSQKELQQESGRVKELYAQLVYKDKMVVDQTNQTVLLEEHMSEFKDHLRNKDEVIEGRDRVIQVRSCERVYLDLKKV